MNLIQIIRKAIQISILLFALNSYSQDKNIGGIPVKGILPIKRGEIKSDANNFSKISNINGNTLTAGTPTGQSTEVGVTQGELSVSLTGAAQYNIPLSLPNGINGVVPQIGIGYNSQSGNGNAGYGWNLTGISCITRSGSTTYYDNKISTVNIDDNDRFMLDGQRLILKTGVYGYDGATYETENQSNLKITSFGRVKNGPEYFIIEYPDGSKAKFSGGGICSNFSYSENWKIISWESPQGIKIEYVYNCITGNNNYLSTIIYNYLNANSKSSVEFIYKNRVREEKAYPSYLNNYVDNKLIDEIKITNNNVPFKNYLLEYDTTSLGYERLVKITEKNGDKTKNLNPTVFTYDNTPSTISYKDIGTTLTVSNINYNNSGTISGDFDGDGSQDIILYPTTGVDAKKKYWYFSNIKGNTTNIAYEHNIGYFRELIPTSWLSQNNKLMPMQGWCAIQYNTTSNITTFKNYSSGTVNPIYYQYEINYQFPKFEYGYWVEPCTSTPLGKQSISSDSQNESIVKPIPDPNQPQWAEIIREIPKEYLGGDFNGDGLTEVLIVEKPFDFTVTQGCSTYTQTFPGGRAYVVNLDRRLISNNVSVIGNLSITGSSKIIIDDVNGDGKSDIIIFENGSVKVYSFDANNVLMSPVVTNDSRVNISTQILLGDYNGDGKTDFIIPKGTGNNYTKFSSTGSKFIIEDATYDVPYQANYQSGSRTYTYYLIPNDFNQDGKTDLIFAQNIYEDVRLINLQQGSILIKNYKNIGSNFVEEMSASSGTQPTIKANALPIFLNNNKSTLKSELNFITNNRIIHFESQKDFNKDRLLRSITLGNGVVNAINYTCLKNIDPDSYGAFDYYPSTYTEDYPNFDITSATNFQVVNLLEVFSHTDYKKQMYRYYGAVSSVDGKGFLGFRAIAKTNWYDNNFPIITNLTKFDINKKGAPYESYTVFGEVYGNVTNFSTSSFISKTTMGYDYQLFPNKVFKLNNISTVEQNGVENTSKEIVTGYDSNNNPKTITTNTKLGSTIEESETTTLDYYSATSAPYIVDRLNKKTSSVTNYNSAVPVDTKTSEETYSYTGNNLTQIKKKGHLTNEVTEDLEYNPFGNLIKKTISANGTASRVAIFEYDPTGRYLTKSITNEGLQTLYNYDFTKGTLTSETDPYGLTTTYDYDTWGKKKTVTDYLGKKTYLTYTNSSTGNEVYVNSTSDDGSFTSLVYNSLGRVIKSSNKNIDGKYSTVFTQYDIYGRPISVSEPYDGSSYNASQFTTTTYDEYGRPKLINHASGKITTLNYTGLTTTSNDGIKNIITTKNSLGQPISVTDNGGTINYTYYADGNLKKSDFEGSITELEYDGWGRKSKLKDASAGEYIYEYNEYGELTKEIAPKGITEYKLNNSGKLIEKTIIGSNGDLTNSKSIYGYNTTTKFLESVAYDDYSEIGHHIDYLINYDNNARISKIVETNANKAIFEKQIEYDEFGRPLREFYKATNLNDNKSSEKWIKNTYKLGFHWQIVDDSSGNTNGKILWETNTVDARGQLTSGKFGNGILQTNTYDQYGFLEKTSHNYTNSLTGTTANIMTLVNSFNPVTSNLNSRTNSLFNTNETFTYDNLDRLIEWSGASKTIYNLKFSNTNEGFVVTNAAVIELHTDKLKVKANSPQSGVQKKVLEKAVFGDKYKVKLNFDDGETAVASYKTRIVVVEENTVTNAIVEYNLGLITEGVFEVEHTIQTDNVNVYIKIDKSENTAGLSAPRTFYIDNFMLIKTGGKNKQSYDNKGRITGNDLGNYNYTDIASAIPKFYRNTSVATTFEATQYYKKNPLQEVDYNVFKSPVKITEQGVDKINYLYNPFDSRCAMYYGNLNDDKTTRPKRKYYSFDGTMEINFDVANNKSEFVTYLGGDAYTAPVILKSDGTAQNYFYLHRDYLGTIVAITNDLAEVVEKRSFDAWGEIASIKDKNNNELEFLTILDRGYTGHEHLQSVGLVHMNGRIYDPKLHRFLQPDNFIQNPFNTQNYNRYGYVLNNPLKYVDPSGEEYNGNPETGGMNETQQSALGNAIANLAQNWDELGIKNWANRNIGFKQAGFAKGGWVDNNLRSIGNWFTKQWKSIFGSNKKSEKVYLPSTPSFSNHQLTGGWQNEGFQPSQAVIQMPTQHTFLGINMTALSEGNLLQRTVYGMANTINIPVQYMMGRSVGDGSMRNLNGTSTSTDEGVLSFGTLPLMFAGGGGGAGVISGNGTKLAIKEVPTIVGEGMKRVGMEAAKHPSSVILNNMPKFTGTADQITSQMMTYNRQWLLQQMRSGRPIINIGLDPNRGAPSIFYQMEQNMIKNYLKLHPNAFQIITP
ncbi:MULTISPECIES: RHS repeat-associated core domain-containing protein [Flavobacterium]|uniref:RHS repeat-associated protein n=1 Tax=Flavobacterium hankyongi TaxID=1176532 RepID=A0ABP8ZRM7_9FLAO|nr:RHS repeat-associated core domain-containing protein [Flavobacterium sp. N1846]